MDKQKLLANNAWKALLTSSSGSRKSAVNRFILINTSLVAVLMALTLLLAPAWNTLQAQESSTITGTVTDAEDGSPLIGVTVVVQGAMQQTGSTIGTSTNIDGEYSIEVPSGLTTLVFSSVGYQTQTVEIDGRSEIDVEMAMQTRELDNVVVVGYGTQRESEITSSVSTIDAGDFQTGNINDSQQLLQGKVAGLSISRPGGDPNGDFTIRLRGLSTLGANQEPLVVIDGITGADLNNVDPNDIESMTVLKDASAGAIYGTRGANGVILVTTRSGGADQPMSVTYSGQLSISDVGEKLEVLSPEAYRNFSIPGNDEFTPTDLGTETDWFDEVTQVGITQTHNLAVSGGNRQTNYSVSGSYRDIQSIQKGSGRQQLNARLNLTHRALNERLRITTNIAITDREEDIGLGEVFRYAALFNPTAPVFDTDGSYFEQDFFDYFNPVAINEQTNLEAQSTRLNMGFRGEYMFDDFVPGLMGSIFYARQSFNQLRGEYYEKDAKFRGAARNGLAIRENFESRNDLVEAQLNYDRSFGQLRFEGTTGYSWQDFTDDNFFAEGGDFINDTFGFNNIFEARDFDRGDGTVSTFRNENRLIGFFGRTNFVIDDTYFLSGALRREGSTRFGEDNQWGTFFSMSGGAELTNLFDVDAIDQMKLRVSYGETGTDAPLNGLSQRRFSSGSSFLVDGEFVPSIGPVTNPNPDLKWEIKRELNVGVDFAALDTRLSGSLDFYQSNTDDLLLEVNVPVPPNQAPTTWINAAEISNTGFEAALNYDAIRTQNVSWSTGITFSTNQSKLESYAAGRQTISNVGAPGLNDTPMILVDEGRDIGDIWGWEFSRIGDDGQWLFLDEDGNEVGTDEIGAEDRRVIGNGLPDFELSWNNNVRYRNFDFSMFWRGAFGHDLVNTYDIFHRNPFFIGSRNVMASTVDIPELTEAPQFSSFQVEDASFFRLENITIGYNFSLPPESLISKLRLYGTINNVYTITGYSGIDPDVRFFDRGPTDNANRAGDPNPLAPGIDRRDQWFTQTSFVFGVNLGF